MKHHGCKPSVKKSDCMKNTFDTYRKSVAYISIGQN